MRFSNRIGARPLPTSGLEEASKDLRTEIWNSTHASLFPAGERDYERAKNNAHSIWNFLGWRVDEVPHYSSQKIVGLSRHWFDCGWADFFDLVEHVAKLLSRAYGDARARAQVFIRLNTILENQGCAYRFISEELAPLTNPTEMAEVERAAESAIPSVAKHIRDALGLLPPATNPTPRNSIKESISAVEAALKHLSGDPSATLGSGLKAFESRYGKLHPALRDGLDKIYGYTSDEKGVRHALIDDQGNVTIDDARFMVVTCSAFANYLIAIAARAPA